MDEKEGHAHVLSGCDALMFYFTVLWVYLEFMILPSCLIYSVLIFSLGIAYLDHDLLLLGFHADTFILCKLL